ncbi:hypothetical protein ABLE68_21955 [Nocardioides sp. CN2-186]|uniref:hypothetical protein n=1 Tax=Nocardioides tweenelious TaxID=3156607 RepID=UPI0032B3BD4D
MNLTRVTLSTASSVLVLAMLSACGGSDTATDSTAAAAQPSQGAAGPGAVPGASGKVAAVSGETAQVQGQSGQVAVSWTGATTFDQEVDGTLDDVQVGSCVRVTTADDSSADSTDVAAATVRIVPSTDGGCGMGGPPGGGDLPSGAPSDVPTDLPTDLPSDMARPGGFGTVGEVTAVSGSGFTVAAAQVTPGQDQSASPTTTDVSVTVSGDTSYVTSAKATASAVKVGVCVNAQGESDNTGALTASSISISKPVGGECTSGFGFMRGGGGGA